jgi:hypothetical protein
MTDQSYKETVSAWREARDKCKPGSERWKECDAELKKAEAALHNHRE